MPSARATLQPMRNFLHPNGLSTAHGNRHGRVAQGGAASCDVEISNVGQRDLVLEQVAILGDSIVTPPESEVEEPFGFFGRPPGEQAASGGRAASNWPLRCAIPG